MNIGAVIVTAGLKDAAMLPVGRLSAVQRMAALFQKAGADIVVVVTGAEDKALEKQLSQPGIVILESSAAHDREQSARIGLEHLCGKCERVFLLDEDRPLIAPDTLRQMLSRKAELIVPIFRERSGKPLLFSSAGVKKALSRTEPRLNTVYEPTEDNGILLSAAESAELTGRIDAHDAMITRPVLDIGIYCGRQLIDKKLVNLLRFIKETQSVREACGRMQISYSTAWNTLNHAEDELGHTLVNRNKGGASGSGTVLTEKGQRLLESYVEYEAALSNSAEKLFRQFFTI